MTSASYHGFHGSLGDMKYHDIHDIAATTYCTSWLLSVHVTFAAHSIVEDGSAYERQRVLLIILDQSDWIAPSISIAYLVHQRPRPYPLEPTEGVQVLFCVTEAR